MDDLFFFSPNDVPLTCLKARDFPQDYGRVSIGTEGATIWHPRDSSRLLMSIYVMVQAELEPKDLEDIPFALKTVWCCSHHPRDIQILIPLLSYLLRHFGGFVAPDEEGFMPRFGAENIDRFSYDLTMG